MKRIAIIGPKYLMIISAAAVGFGFQLLLIPEKLLSSWLSGVAMVIGYISGWNIGWLYFALNVPILLWGYRILGKRFIGLSMVTVLSTVFFLQVIPLIELTDNRLLASVFGGVLVGLGTSVTLRYGGSSGGFDIIASIISRYRDLPIGILMVLLNTFVVAALVFLQNDWNAALYSMLSIYLTGRIIDAKRSMSSVSSASAELVQDFPDYFLQNTTKYLCLTLINSYIILLQSLWGEIRHEYFYGIIPTS
jgi:uncharacterized membrane-anchored protein YitT (DUF2179 family)